MQTALMFIVCYIAEVQRMHGHVVLLECVYMYIVLTFMTLSDLHQLSSIWNVITPDLVKRYCYTIT